MSIYNNEKKNSRLTILSMIPFFFLMACKNKDKIVLHENITSFSKFPKEINVSFKELYEYNKGTPKSMHSLDSTLIIFNVSHKIESFFYNYSLKTGQLSEGYLKKGRGPNEAIGGFCSGLSGNNLWAYDLTLKKIFITDKTKAITNNNPSFHVSPLKTDFYNIILLDSNRFLVNGKEDSKFKIQEIDASGEVITEFGEFKHIPADMPLGALKDACHSFFFLKPSGGKVAMSYLHTDVLEIYDMEKPFKSKAVQGPVGFDLDFKIGKRGKYNYMEKTDETKKAFIAGAVTDKYIYLAYSGISHTKKTDWSYAKFVYVYDWDGNPVKKLNLDRRISGLTVSQDDKTMYSYDVDKGFLVEAKIN
ncbi:BF3164 family lipoprotein [Pedobacter sp. Hv1]|uniref:BF3164 family lipoprotein n=1 Tax=Pedobacter sp. Hv1 TaxID=1740090 RepID=UPI0006D8C884|nr:BF3164 family lipoprotein [Pedobacter sp. Hv1]KQC02757.1 hypothetical protein AQF98_04060 [Pedobacter sp. Hv1]